jgi:serine/threonine-protein kinase
MKPKDADPSVDLWALAVTAYAALTAELPFEGDSLGELCVKVLNAELEPPSRHRPDLPPAVDRWFERALHPKREARFAAPEEMATTFREAAMGHPVATPHLDTSDPVEVPALPQPEPATKQVWPVALGLAAVVVVGAGAWWLRAKPTSPGGSPAAESAIHSAPPAAVSSAAPAPEPLAAPSRSGEATVTDPSSRAPAPNTPRRSLARTAHSQPVPPGPELPEPAPPTAPQPTETSEPKVEDRGAPDNPGF